MNNTNLHLGACLVAGKLHATVMRRDGSDRITVVAVAEIDEASLRASDCHAVMQAPTAAVRDVLAERQRQISAEGWTPTHDDQHGDGSLALAAACYACNAATWAQRAPSIPALNYEKFSAPGFRWPWAQKWWKPKSQRQDLIRAAALILAEIERLDRADVASRHAAAAPWIG